MFKRRSFRMNLIHFRTLFNRYFLQIFSNKSSLLMLILQVPLMLLVVLIMYKTDCFYNPTKMYDQNITIFILVVINSFMGLLNSYREITKEQEILSREITGGLDPNAYVASKLIVLGIISFVQALVLMLGSFLFIRFNFTIPIWQGFLYFISMFLVGLASTSIGLLISALLKNSEGAVMPVLLIMICQVVFSGTIINFTGVISVIVSLTPTFWGVAILGNATEIQNIPRMSNLVYHQNVYVAIGALVFITILCFALTTIVIKHRYKKISR